MPVPPFASFDAAVSHLREIGKDGTAAKPMAKVVVVGPPGGGRKLLLRALAADCPFAEVVSVLIEHGAVNDDGDTEQPRVVIQQELVALFDAAALGLGNTGGPVLLCTAPLPTALDAAEREAARAAADAALRVLLAGGVPLGVVFVAGEQGGRLRPADLDGVAAVEGFVGPLGRGAAAVVVNGVDYAELDEPAAAYEATVTALIAKSLGERHGGDGECAGCVAFVPKLSKAEREDTASAAMSRVVTRLRDVVGALQPCPTLTTVAADARFELPGEADQSAAAAEQAAAAAIAADSEVQRAANQAVVAQERAVADDEDRAAQRVREEVEAIKRTTAAVNASTRRHLRHLACAAMMYVAVFACRRFALGVIRE